MTGNAQKVVGQRALALLELLPHRLSMSTKGTMNSMGTGQQVTFALGPVALSIAKIHPSFVSFLSLLLHLGGLSPSPISLADFS